MRKKGPAFTQYQPLEGELTNRQLRFAEWYIVHRETLRTALVAFLVVLDILLVGVSGAFWLRYVIVDYQTDKLQREQLAASFQDFTRLYPLYVAQPVRLKQVTILRAGADRFDLFTEAFNPNERWIVTIEYHYEFTGGVTQTESVLLLPGQVGVLPSLGITNRVFPSQARLVIERQTWHKISPSEVRNMKGFLEERLRFVADNVLYTPADGRERLVASVQFTVTNTSLYGYWEANFFAVLYERGRLVGIRPLSVNRLLSESEQQIDLTLFNLDGVVTEIDLIPVMNLFDAELYLDRFSL